MGLHRLKWLQFMEHIVGPLIQNAKNIVIKKKKFQKNLIQEKCIERDSFVASYQTKQTTISNIIMRTRFLYTGN